METPALWPTGMGIGSAKLVPFRWDYTGTDFEHTPNIVLFRSSGESAIDQHVANHAAPLAAETVLAEYHNRAYQTWAEISKD